jgi:hypothetical protein
MTEQFSFIAKGQVEAFLRGPFGGQFHPNLIEYLLELDRLARILCQHLGDSKPWIQQK